MLASARSRARSDPRNSTRAYRAWEAPAHVVRHEHARRPRPVLRPRDKGSGRRPRAGQRAAVGQEDRPRVLVDGFFVDGHLDDVLSVEEGR